MNEIDEKWMRIALDAASAAGARDEVPIGACIVGADGEVIASAGNRTIEDNDPTAHAEILVIREAAARIGNYRLTDSTIYSTVEPCAMCAGALVNARVKRLVYGTRDERFGAVETVFRICDNESLNHRLEIETGVMTEECRAIMQEFFRKKRARQKSLKIVTTET